MIHSQRHAHILLSLEKSERIRVHELAAHCGVTAMTIRRDLLDLERKGLLVRRYGGAVRTTAAHTFFSFYERLGRNKVAKKAIGRAAAALVQDNDTIFIDCGSTPFQMTRHLFNRRNLRVITNSLPVVSELLHNPGIRIIILGGELVHSRRATQGRLSERLLGEYRADKAFIGADGISVDSGLSAYNELEGGISRRMMEQSRESYLLCDSSKLGKDSLFPFKPAAALTALITDKRSRPDVIARFRRAGLNVMTAG